MPSSCVSASSLSRFSLVGVPSLGQNTEVCEGFSPWQEFIEEVMELLTQTNTETEGSSCWAVLRLHISLTHEFDSMWTWRLFYCTVNGDWMLNGKKWQWWVEGVGSRFSTCETTHFSACTPRLGSPISQGFWSSDRDRRCLFLLLPQRKVTWKHWFYRVKQGLYFAGLFFQLTF